MQALTPGKDGDAYRASFIKGIRYLLAAQYPNGGFPQVYPLEGGYHDAITFNDNAVSESAETLGDVAEAKPGYDFVPADLRKQAGAAVDRALQCILASQITIDGKKTIWPQQEDALTLAPVSARNYEPGALAASESADLLEYLMSIQNPSKELVASIDAGVTASPVFGCLPDASRGKRICRPCYGYPRKPSRNPVGRCRGGRGRRYPRSRDTLPLSVGCTSCSTIRRDWPRPPRPDRSPAG